MPDEKTEISCKDCKHSESGGISSKYIAIDNPTEGQCFNGESFAHHFIVYGSLKYTLDQKDCRADRTTSFFGFCGPDAGFFKSKVA